MQEHAWSGGGWGYQPKNRHAIKKRVPIFLFDGLQGTGAGGAMGGCRVICGARVMGGARAKGGCWWVQVGAGSRVGPGPMGVCRAKGGCRVWVGARKG